MNKVKWFIKKAVYPCMEKKKGNQVRIKTEELKTSQFLTGNQLDNLQRKKLRKLLLLCINDVPAYQKFSHLEQMIKEDPYKALKNFPILAKTDFMGNSVSFLNETAHRDSLIENSTGGSTGEAVKFYMDRHMVEYYEAARFRGLSWWGITHGSPCVMIWGNPTELNRFSERKHRFKERWLKNRIIISAYSIKPDSIDSYISMIRNFNPEYIYGYSSALYLFSELMLKRKLRIGISLKAVVSTAETLHDFQREIIEEAFKCPVADEYGARDGGIIAYQCKEGSMHISCENVYVEFVDSVSFEPVTMNESGIILLTDLNNYVMPRLRYRVGDLGAPSDKICPCGISLPVLARLEGREADMFVTVDGRYVHGHAFNKLSRSLRSIKKFQIIQDSPDYAQVLLVLHKPNNDDEVPKFRDLAEELLPGTHFDISIVDDISVSASGKYRHTIRGFDL